MDRIPEIGTRVSYPGGLVVGPCTGTVRAIYPAHDPAPGYEWEDEEVVWIKARFDPERWKVSMEVDELPEKWCYGELKFFAPAIADIEPIKEEPK